MQRYGVSRWTSREALATLASEGLITKIPKVGTFVRERPQVKRHGLERYARSRWLGQDANTILRTEATAQGTQASRIIRELAELPGPAEVTDRLNTPPNMVVWTRKRTAFLDGRPSQLADSYYPLDVVKGTALVEVETGPGGDFARLDEAGHTPSRIREEWQARMPTAPETAQLQLPPGTPVLDFVRTIFDQDGRPVEVMLSVIAADTASFVYDFPIPD
jgi:GntR family transcriptional regulator